MEKALSYGGSLILHCFAPCVVQTACACYHVLRCKGGENQVSRTRFSFWPLCQPLSSIRTVPAVGADRIKTRRAATILVGGEGAEIPWHKSELYRGCSNLHLWLAEGLAAPRVRTVEQGVHLGSKSEICASAAKKSRGGIADRNIPCH